MSKELPNRDHLNSTPTVTQYKQAIGDFYDYVDGAFLDPVAGGGAANVQTATLGESGGYKTDRIYVFKPTFSNTAACTINFDGLGAKSVKLIDTSDPYAGAIQSGVPAYLRYDGTNLVLLNPYFPLTAAGRALLDDANAAAQLATLGLTPTAAKLNVAGNIVTGSFTKNSVGGTSFSSVQSITHGLGTDEVSLEVCVTPSGSGTPGMWTLQWYGPGRRGTTIVGPSGFQLTLGDRSPPASGTIDIYLHNNSSSSRNYTVAYKISALA